MPDTLSSLLPGNKTPIMGAVTDAAVFPPVSIRLIHDPAQTPTVFLPWLAAHAGVRLWFNDWSVSRKRQIVADQTLGWSIGTRSGARRHLAYVDATIVDAMAYPARRVIGRGAIGRGVIEHPSFKARYLVRRLTNAPPGAHVVAVSAIGRKGVRTTSFEPFRRCLVALRTAKAAETEIRVDFSHHRMLTAGDAVPANGTFHVGQYLARTKL